MPNVKVTPGRGLRIQKTGTFQLEKIIEKTISLLESLNYEVQKKKHVQKVKDTGTEIEHRISAEKEVTDFYKFEINIRLFFQHIKPIKTIKQTYADIIIEANLICDYNKNWQTSKLKTTLLNIYLNHLKKDEMESYWVKLYNETEKLRKKIKSMIK